MGVHEKPDLPEALHERRTHEFGEESEAFLPQKKMNLGLTKIRDELRDDADEQLFFSSHYNPNHVLHRLLPQPKRTDYNLRQRTHSITLPADGDPVMKQNFVNRMVFKDIY